MKSVLKAAVIVSAATWSTAGFSFFDAEVFYGSTTSEVAYTLSDNVERTKSVNGTEMGASLMLDPIPLVPFAFGVVATQGTRDLSDVAKLEADDLILDSTFGGGTTTAEAKSKTLMYGAAVKVWVPLKVKPYLKLAYLTGAEAVDQKLSLDGAAMDMDFKTTTTYKHTATEVTVGLGYSPLKLVGVFAEYSIHSGKRKATKMTGDATASVGGATGSIVIDDSYLSDSDKKERPDGARSVRLGVSVGI